MCGIFAVSGVVDSANVVLSGLKSLEYRGYDSWGIGVPLEGVFKLEKYEGKISASKSSLPQINMAFGHTRWATHGGVTVPNAHPHTDCSGRIAVVHNGIVENYEAHKQKLVKAGHVFHSQTDTEVIAHLIEQQMKSKELLESVRTVFAQLKGFSALVAFDAGSNEFIAVRRGSPLVVGLSDHSVFISSDALSLAAYTRRIVYLPDDVFVQVFDGQVKFFDKVGKQKKLKEELLDQSIVPAVKGKFAHYMIKEIHDQPRVVSNAIANMDTAVALLAKEIGQHKSVTLFACGSAYFASLFGGYLLSSLAKIRCQAVSANEFKFVEPWLGKQDYALYVSQSGETMDVLEAVAITQKKGAATGALVNVIGSSLSRRVGSVVPLSAGPEIGVASTKVITSMLTAFYLLAGKLGGVSDSKIKDTVSKAARACATVIQGDYQHQYIAPLVSRLKNEKHIFVLGKDKYYPIALEAALKLKEITYIHAEGFASGELKHGVIALVDKGTPCIVFVPEDETKDDVLSAAAEVKARGAYLIGIGPVKHSLFDHHVPTENVGDLSAIPMITVIQLLAYHLAVALKLDPDKPRNLAKSVTVK